MGTPKGRIPWNKGKKKREKLICKACNKEFFVVPSSFKYRNVQYCSIECYHKNTNHNRAQGKRWHLTTEQCERVSERQIGKKNHQWRGGISINGRTGKLILFKKFVKDKDKYKCVICNSNNNLVVHHLNSYARFPELRIEMSNGVTLCEECHKGFHAIYGYRENVVSQFVEFVKDETRKNCEVRERIGSNCSNLQFES